MKKVSKLADLPNIGKEIEDQLKQIGIFTYDDLCRIGAEQTWLKIQAIDPSACINKLLALEGTIQGVKKTLLAEERKLALKEFYSMHKLT